MTNKKDEKWDNVQTVDPKLQPNCTRMTLCKVVKENINVSWQIPKKKFKKEKNHNAH